MNRSALLEEITGIRLPGRTLTVAASWVHPRRGAVTSPGHPALADAVTRFPRPTAVRDLTALGCPEDGGDGVLIALSYTDVSGGVRGLALGAAADDTEALDFARREMASWRSALRTRRLLVVPVPAAGTRTVHRAAPFASLTAGRDAWSPCGCPRAANCPAVADAVATSVRYRTDGDHVLLVGSPLTHDVGPPPVVSVLRGVTAVPTVEAARTLDAADPATTSFVVAPGAAVPQVSAVLKTLRDRFGPLRGQHPGQWCYTMTDLHLVITATLCESDQLLVDASDHSPAARLARGAAREAGVPVHPLTSPHALRPERIDASALMLLDPTPGACLGAAMACVLDGLGQCATVQRTVHSRTGVAGRGPAAPGRLVS